MKFSCTYWPLSFYKIFKKSDDLSRVMRICRFRDQNGPFVMNNFFLLQTIIITFIYLLAFFNVQNFKKFFQQIQSYEDAQFLCTKWPISPNENFFSEKLLINLVSFIHAYIHSKNQSQILIY